MLEGIQYIWYEFVPRHLSELNCRFFDRFEERITHARSAGERVRLQNLFGMVLKALVFACEQPVRDLIAMTDRPDLLEADIEHYLEVEVESYHFALYPVVIYLFMQLYEQWEGLHTSDQAWQGPMMKMVLRVASRLQPDAKKVAALLATAAPT